MWLTQGPADAIQGDEPIVAVNHGSAWTVEPRFWDFVPREFAKLLIADTEATLEKASCIIAPSEYTRSGLVEYYGFSEERVFAVPHGVDSTLFRPDRRGGAALVENSLGQRRPYVLFASIPSIQQKNLAGLRTALGRLIDRGLPHCLVIAGGTAGGESEALLAEIAADLPGHPGSVVWLGSVDDHRLAGLMAEADAFCLPSHFESFGLTALEAMACGAPVVVSDRGALPEVVGDGAVVADTTPTALEEALSEVLTNGDVASYLRAAGLSRAKRMSWARTADGWCAALRTAATKG